MMGCVGLLLSQLLLAADSRMEHRSQASTEDVRQYLEQHRDLLPAKFQWLLKEPWPAPEEQPTSTESVTMASMVEPKLPLSTDVLIVGGGTSGLTAALELVEQGTKVVVVEKMDRVGGRVQSVHLDDGTNVDLGGQWIGPTQYEARKLIKRFGLTLHQTYYDPVSAHVDGAPEDAKKYRKQLNDMALTLPPHLDAGEVRKNTTLVAWDSLSLSQWVDMVAAHISWEGQYYLKTLASGGLNQEAETMSLLFFLQAIRTWGGGIEADEGLTGGAQDSVLVEGTQMISKRLADEVTRLGAQVFQGVIVSEVLHNMSTVEVRTSGGQAIVCSHVIVAMGSADRQTLKFNPPLPDEYTQWSKSWPTSTAMKMFLVFDHASWRNTSRAVPGLQVGPLPIFDNSYASGTPGVAMALFKPFAPKVIQEWAYAALVGLAFGRWDHKRYIQKTWTMKGDSGLNSWVHNCVGAAPPGALTKYGRGWRDPLGRIHWAGSDTADEWQGYISGAASSGRRVAAEVLGAQSLKLVV